MEILVDNDPGRSQVDNLAPQAGREGDRITRIGTFNDISKLSITIIIRIGDYKRTGDQVDEVIVGICFRIGYGDRNGIIHGIGIGYYVTI